MWLVFLPRPNLQEDPSVVNQVGIAKTTYIPWVWSIKLIESGRVGEFGCTDVNVPCPTCKISCTCRVSCVCTVSRRIMPYVSHCVLVMCFFCVRRIPGRACAHELVFARRGFHRRSYRWHCWCTRHWRWYGGARRAGTDKRGSGDEWGTPAAR